MSEQVQTGGLMQFQYEKTDLQSIDPERKNAIEAGYAEYDARKKRNKILAIILILIIIIVTVYFLINN